MTLTPPTSALIVFNNKDLSNWTQRDGAPATWAVANGVMTVANGDIMTKELLTDFRLHMQFMVPDMT